MLKVSEIPSYEEFYGLIDNELSDDEAKVLEEKVQKLTDKFIAEVDSMISAKSDEILTV